MVRYICLERKYLVESWVGRFKVGGSYHTYIQAVLGRYLVNYSSSTGHHLNNDAPASLQFRIHCTPACATCLQRLQADWHIEDTRLHADWLVMDG